MCIAFKCIGKNALENGVRMNINRYLGRQLCFNNGFKVGFSWVHSNGETSKRSAVLAAYHPPRSITWLWAVHWTKPYKNKLFCLPNITRWNPPGSKIGRVAVMLPIIGNLSFSWQQATWRDNQ